MMLLAEIPAAYSKLYAIDYTIIVVYMLGVLAIGTYYGRYVSSASDFFLGGKALPFWAVGMSIVVSDIGATDMVSGAGATYEYGIAQANFDWLGSIPAALIAALVFIPYYWRAGVYTIPEFLGRRYNAAVQLIQAFVWMGFLVAMLAIMLWLSAVFLNGVLGIPTMVAIWLTVAIVGIYTVSGGLAAVVMTDVMQMVVMFVGAAALLALSLYHVGGFDGLVDQLNQQGEATEHHLTLLLPHDTETPYPWTGIVFGLGLVLSTAYFVGNQAVVQRVLGARSEWDAKAGMIFAGFLKLFIPLLLFLPGLAARIIYPELDKADLAVPTLVRHLLPPGLTGLMFAAFFAALMSSVDSYLNSCATVFISDIYGRIHELTTGRTVSQSSGLRLGRIVTVVVILLAAICAPIVGGFNTIYVAVQTILSLLQGPTLAILLLGILWRRANQWGALVGLIVGLVSTSILTIIGGDVFPSDDPFLFVALWSFLITAAITVIVSLVTPADPMERIRGLVFGSVLLDDTTQNALRAHVDAQQGGST